MRVLPPLQRRYAAHAGRPRRLPLHRLTPAHATEHHQAHQPTNHPENHINSAGAATIIGHNPDPQPAAGPSPTGPDDTPAPGLPVRTAFVIYQDYDGAWVGTNDPALISDKLTLDKTAHPDEITAGCSVVADEIVAQKTAMQVHNVMMAAARQAAEAQANAAILNQVRNAPRP
ncbi:hypothetical protein [Nonomuraea typhae]|uniref:hypothetical protein n=1 Tax=Nonomuraea typhae TaxID=2603600 RepID=UPI0012F7DEC1|nr:hypothetical protein [Nonomuraea typhae]